MTEETIGRPRPLIAALPAYRPGKGAKQAEQEHGITNAIKLASNENPEEPLDPIVAAVAAAAHGINRYPDHRATAVREAIAARLDVGVEQVTIGTGSSGLLQQFVWAYVDPDDEVLYPWRSFEAYPIFTNLARRRVGDGSTQRDLSFDADGLVGAVTPRTKLLMLATPNNPTGIATSTRDLAAIVEHIPSDVIIVIDEAYREFVDPAYGDPSASSCRSCEPRGHAYLLQGARARRAPARLRDRRPAVIATVDKTLLPFAVNSACAGCCAAAIEHEGAMRGRSGILAERGRVEDRTLPRRLEAAGPPGQLRLAAHRRRNRRRRARARTARSSCGRSRATACGSRSARTTRTIVSSPPWRRSWPRAPSRCATRSGSTCGRRGRRWLLRFCSWSSCSRRAASPTCSGGPCAESSISTPAMPTRQTRRAPFTASRCSRSPPAASQWRRRSATWCTGVGRSRTGIEAVAASARGEGRDISFRATTLRVAATWIVSAGLVSIGRESAIVESGGSLGSVIGRRSGAM